MDKAYFTEYYYLERKNWWFTVRKRILSERINHLLHSPSDIYSLNVGAATGTTSDMLTQFGRVMSVEYDQDCCDFTKTFLTSSIIQGTITDLPFEEASFDLVCAFDVIEHVADDTKSIDEMYRVCKPGGYLAITVPAYAFLWGPHDVINHHFRRYTLQSVLELVNKHKGSVIYKTYYNSILFLPVAAYRVLASLLLFFKRKKEPSAVSDHEIFGTEGIFNNLLASLFTIDYYLLKWGIRFPAGVSIMVFFKKQ